MEQADPPGGTAACEEPMLKQGRGVRKKEQQRETAVYCYPNLATAAWARIEKLGVKEWL